MLKSIGSGDYMVLLDERGRDLSSEGMARLIAEAGDRGAASLVFCIGKSAGFTHNIQKLVVVQTIP